MSVLTLLVFIYYTTDITAEMTSTGLDIPINTFDDVIYHDYKVVAVFDHTIELLGNSKPGSAKHLAHARLQKVTIEEALELVSKDPKTLFYGWESVIANDELKRFRGQVYALKMDDATYTLCAFALKKNSEFIPIINYYLQKQLEHGITKKLYRNHYNSLYVHESFGIAEPQPLGYENAIFPFIVVVTSSIASVFIAMVEKFYHATK